VRLSLQPIQQWLFAALLLLCPILGFSHSVWLEDTPDGKLVLRFAEPGEDFEKSPGHLDDLGLPVAWIVSPESEPVNMEVRKASDHFLLTAATPNKPAFAETDFAVMGAKDKPGRKPYFYARWHVAGAAAKPMMNFDIVPTGEHGTVQVYFQGKPLPGAKITFRPPKGEDKELIADKDGIAHFQTTGPGLYLMTCAHQREPIAGFSGGVPYDAVSHNCSLAWREK
jgi:hypothetical protein